MKTIQRRELAEKILNAINTDPDYQSVRGNDLSVTDVDKVIKLFGETLALELAEKSDDDENRSFRLPAIGTLRIVDRKERKARNPKTGESLRVFAYRDIAISNSESFRDDLNPGQVARSEVIDED